jgi:hypothetical protein
LSGEPHNEREAISALASLLAKMAVKQPVARQLLDVYTRLGEQGLREIMDAFEGIVAEHAKRLPPAPTPAPAASVVPSAAEKATTPPGSASFEPTPNDASSEPPPFEPVLRVDPSAFFDAPQADEAGEEGDHQALEGEAGEKPIPFATESPARAQGAGNADDDLDRRPHFEAPAGPVSRPHHMRTPFQYDDDDVVYVHGVTIVPVDEKSEPRPFMLEEKGLDSREFAFALDRGGLRFFLSRLDRRSISVSTTGLMLSGKQESLRLQGVHEGVLNDLRAHGVVLPFEFGTIARSREELLMLIDDRLYDLHDAVDDLMATSWWKLSASMLDAKLAGIIGSEPGAGERERRVSSRPSAPAAKIDIKMLERILGRQKRIAESVNEELKKVADRAEVEMMVGFSSGTSDDWKPILRAKYLVPPSRVHKLHRAINDIQYRHMLFELMLALTGDQAAFALHAAR